MTNIFRLKTQLDISYDPLIFRPSNLIETKLRCLNRVGFGHGFEIIIALSCRTTVHHFDVLVPMFPVLHELPNINFWSKKGNVRNFIPPV